MISLVITLKWMLLVITLTQVNADDTHGIERRDTNADATKKIVCYYTNWSVYRPGTAKFSPQNINPYLCTHLIYAFGGLDKENGLRPYDKYQDIEQGGYAKFTGLKTYNKNLKTMLAIGGWNEGSSKFSALVADEERRGIFTKNVIKFLRQNNFDGLDLDWEYPAFRDGSKPEDKDNYASLVKELREEFEKESSKTGRPRLLLTMAVPAGVEYIDKGYDVSRLNKYLDFMNILSYDYHSAYEPNVNHHSPLYSLQEESEYNFDAQLTIDHTVNHYLKKGVDREKLILGIPTYGRSYTLFNADSTDLGSPADAPGEQGEATREKGYLAYYEICAALENNDQWKVVQPKKSAMGPYAFRGNQWVSYDDADIVKLKAKYVNEKGLGGIMYWSIDNDDFRGKCHGKPYPLIEAGKESLLTNGAGSSANVISSSTSEEKRSSKFANKRNRPKSQSSNSVSTTTKQPLTSSTTNAANTLSTPEPPTTPDPGTDFVCKEEGFFPHPRDCKKYFWCLDSGPSNLGIVAHQFTCPSGLMFNKAADSCDYSRNVICNKKSEKSSTTTTAKSISSTSSKPNTKSTSKTTTTTTTSTTTTTTTAEPTPSQTEEDYEDVEDVDSQEDPKAIKQLITLIKKLGGIAELEKQLKLEDGSMEATTPAISRNLYNKVFSSPSSSRYKNQFRNGPSSPQRETIQSANDDVPYYRKEKPQYVTIQRSRPLKTAAQEDAEDSGTTNNKSVQPSKYQEESVDYADDVSQVEITTHKYSSPPRYRTSAVGADSRGTTLKYVTLERNRLERTTTTDEELKAESPAVTTQRYITLVRQKPSTVVEYEEVNTEPVSTQRTSATQPKPQTDSSTGDKLVKEKVSETSESNTNLPVTSAQYRTDRVVLAHQLTTHENFDTIATVPKTYLVFSKKGVDVTNKSESVRRDDVFVETTTAITDTPATPTASTTEYVTETSVPSTSTTVISSIRESATQKTRISLKRYKEYLRNNKTDLLHQLESESNKIFAQNTKQASTDVQKRPTHNSDSAINERTTVSLKRLNYTPLVPNKTSDSAENTLHSSRFFLRRHKNVSSTVTPMVDGNSTESATAILSGSRRKFTRWPIESTTEESYNDKYDGSNGGGQPSTTKAIQKNQFRYKYRSSLGTQTPTLESGNIASSHTRLRFPSAKPVDLANGSTSVTVNTAAPPVTKASRYFSRNRKTSSFPTTMEASTSKPTTAAVAAVSTAQSEILDSDENRYQVPRPSVSEPTRLNNSSQVGVNSIATTTVFDPNSSYSTANVKQAPASAATNEVPSPQDDGGSESNDGNLQTQVTTKRLLKNETEVREPIKAVRNNSRFLKNPEPEYSVGATTTSDQMTHRFGPGTLPLPSPFPIRVTQTSPRSHRIEYSFRDSDDRTAAVGHGDDAGTRRGRKKFSHSANLVPNSTLIAIENNLATTETFKNSRQRSRPQTQSQPQSRFRPKTHTTAESAPRTNTNLSTAYQPTAMEERIQWSANDSHRNAIGGRSASRLAASTAFSRPTTKYGRNWTDAREDDSSVVLDSLENDFREASRATFTLPTTDADRPYQHQNRGRSRFSSYRPTNRTETVENIGGLNFSDHVTNRKPSDSGGRSKSRHFTLSNDSYVWTTAAVTTSTTTQPNSNENELRKTKVLSTRNRGKIKAQNSLSKSEIRELASLQNPPSEIVKAVKKKPKPIVEEAFASNAVNVDSNAYLAATDADAFVAAVPLVLERSFEETTDAVYVLDSNAIANTESDVSNINRYSKNPIEKFEVSETKYVAANYEEQHTRKLSEFGNNETTNVDHSEPSSRYRENFRRTTSPRSRSRSTTTTTTTEYTFSNEPAKVANRFRRRKIKPENRNISSSRNENLVQSVSHPFETSTIKPKRIDISQRGSTTISDFLPVPAQLYTRDHTNSNIDIRYNINGVNTDDLEAQTINTRTNYYNTEDVSDLADPAVVAIHNLKTVPPASQQLSYSKKANSFGSEIAYSEEISSRPFPTMKATPTPIPTTIVPISNSRSSIRRGTVRLSSKTTTTARIPSLQDIYNDYHETDIEYHADPVEIPITGKVRIHSDGYIECLDMGNFPHPFSCKKFISCAKMEYDSLLGWEYTCPKGLSFDPIGGICNWAAGLGCKE